MKNTKGLSTVVTTLIIILLVLVAIGIVWVVIRGVIETGAGQIDAKANCIGVELSIVGNPTCTASTSCSVTVKRNPGGGNIAGILATITDSAGTAVRQEGTTPLDELAQTTITITDAGVAGGTPTAASVAALVDNGEGGTVACDLVTEWP